MSSASPATALAPRVEVPAGVAVIVADYDAASTRPGASGVAGHWRSLLRRHPAVALRRELGPAIPALLRGAARELVADDRRPLLLGGDHSLTWPVLEAVVDRYGPVTVVHLDAHHDAYPGAALTHYTVFQHVRRRLGVEVLGFGHRWECAPAPDRPAGRIPGPVYVSVDVDFLDPQLVPSVMHAVPPAPGQRCDLDALTAVLSAVDGPVLGADVVEWTGGTDPAETAVVGEVLRLVAGLFR